MKSNVTINPIVIALIVGFGAEFALRPVLAPPAAPATVANARATPAAGSAGVRSQQYFAAHIDEARKFVAGCQSGSARGDECFNAGQAVTEADGRARFNKFFAH